MKKLLCLLLALTLCVFFAACEKPIDTDDSNQQGGSYGDATANDSYFQWSETNDAVIVACTEAGLKQKVLVIPASCEKLVGLESTTVEKVTFESDDTVVASNAFRDCTALKEVELPANMTIVDDDTFNGCTSLATIKIPANVTTIGEGAFSDCESLSKVEFNDQLEAIERKAFYQCAALKSVNIPNSVTEIAKQAFAGCAGLTEAVFGTGLKTVGVSAFEGCDALKQIKLPEGVTKLEENAFAFCEALEAIYLPKSLEDMHKRAIGQTHMFKVYVHEGSYADQAIAGLNGTEYIDKLYQ